MGGKAANLGELISAGLPVPGGFCVTTAAYARAATDVDTADPVRARELLRSAPLPDDVATAVVAAYRHLCARDDGVDPAGGGEPDVPVAVRSSATAEDLPTASFAGQQDTYLNVVGVEALIDAVRRCWASLWTDRAVAYRADLGIDDAEVRLAVVVQRMVDAQVAGVLFTADPVSGRRTRAVLDASPGLGEAVVSGMVNPDHLAVEDGRVVDRRLGDKAVAVRALAGGGTERVELRRSGPPPRTDPTPASPMRRPSRSPRSAGGSRRTSACRRTSSGPSTTPARSGYAGAADHQPLSRAAVTRRCAARVRLRQPGPGTDPADHADGAGRLRGHRRHAGAAVRLPGPHATDLVAPPPAFAAVGGRAFVDVTAVLRNPLGRAVATRVLGIMEARTGVVLRDLFADPAFTPVPGARRRALRRIVPVLVRLRVPLVVAQAIASPTAARRRVTASAPAPPPPPPPRRARPRPSGWIARPRRSRRPWRCSPAAHRPSRPASSCGRSRAGWPGRTWTTSRWTPCCARCRTTSPPRWTC